MNHSFSIDLASKYGIEIAIFLENMAFWTKKNQANKKHFHDNRYWTYNTYEAFAELFPYWSPRQIKYIIQSCVTIGLIVVSNYNSKKYDRTNWYALSDLGLACFPALQSATTHAQPDKTKLSHGSDKIVSPIPDTFTDINNNSEQSSPVVSTSNEITPVELLAVYEEELPENPKVAVNPSTGAIDPAILKEIKVFKKYYLAKYNEALTKDLFRLYLQGLKEDVPQLAQGIHKIRGKRNGLITFVRWKFFENYINDNFFNT